MQISKDLGNFTIKIGNGKQKQVKQYTDLSCTLTKCTKERLELQLPKNFRRGLQKT